MSDQAQNTAGNAANTNVVDSATGSATTATTAATNSVAAEVVSDRTIHPPIYSVAELRVRVSDGSVDVNRLAATTLQLLHDVAAMKVAVSQIAAWINEQAARSAATVDGSGASPNASGTSRRRS